MAIYSVYLNNILCFTVDKEFHHKVVADNRTHGNGCG